LKRLVNVITNKLVICSSAGRYRPGIKCGYADVRLL